MPDANKLEHLTSCTDLDFEEFYRIYAGSISQREQKSRDWICRMVARSDYKVLVLKNDDRVIGFSILFLPVAEPFGLLEYMAIRAEQRNHGLGGEMFRRTMQSFQPRSMSVLLEVDSEREECSDRQLRARRQQFYRRLGCLRLAALHYILPLAGGGPPPEMDLMVYSSQDLRHIARPELERWLRVIYHEVYNCSPDDPRIRQMLSPVPDPVLLE